MVGKYLGEFLIRRRVVDPVGIKMKQDLFLNELLGDLQVSPIALAQLLDPEIATLYAANGSFLVLGLGGRRRLWSNPPTIFREEQYATAELVPESPLHIVELQVPRAVRVCIAQCMRLHADNRF